MCEYLFLYNITNGKNRISDNEGENEENNEEDREGRGSEDESSEAGLDPPTDIDGGKSGMTYSCNIIILN
jgi:hypothetical protein